MPVLTSIVTKLYSYKNVIIRFLCTFIQLQLVLTLVSLPILLLWGLPLSLASPLGNLLFNPFIIVFLLLSCLIFFCELVYIPNSALIVTLEYVSSWWLSIIDIAQRSWLIRYAQPSLLIACSIPIITGLLLHNRRLIRQTTSICALVIFTCIVAIYLSYTTAKHNEIYTIDHGAHQVTVIKVDNAHLLLDAGCFGQRVNMPTWVKHTLSAQLTTYGIAAFDRVILLKPSITAFRSLTQLCKKYPIKEIYIPQWNGTLTYTGWQAWEELLRVMHRYTTRLIHIENTPITLCLSGDNYVTLKPTSTIYKKNNFTYRRIQIVGSVMNQKLAIT